MWYHKLVYILFIIFFIGFSNSLFADETTTVMAGVSYLDKVPSGLMGTWRVSAKLITTDSPQNFKKNSIDIWNLSKNGNVINLSNPFTGASASIDVSYADQKSIKFTRVGNYDNQRLMDIVELELGKDTFRGKNKLELVTYSDVDNKIIKTKTAEYELSGNKISGTNIVGK